MTSLESHIHHTLHQLGKAMSDDAELILEVYPAVAASGCLELNTAPEGSFQKTLNIRLIDSDGDLHPWFTASAPTTLTPGGTFASPPALNDDTPPFNEGEATVIVTYDTDEGVGDVYAPGDTVTVTAGAITIKGAVVDVTGAVFTDTVAADLFLRFTPGPVGTFNHVLNTAAAGTVVVPILIELVDANGVVQEWYNEAHFTLAGSITVNDMDIGQPALDDVNPTFVDGVATVNMTYDTDEAATKEYYATDEVSVASLPVLGLIDGKVVDITDSYVDTIVANPLVLKAYYTAPPSSAIDLNQAAVGTVEVEIEFRLEDDNGNVQTWYNVPDFFFPPIITATCADNDINAPGYIPPGFVDGVLTATLVYDTDEGALKTYQEGDEIEMLAAPWAQWGMLVNVDEAVFSDEVTMPDLYMVLVSPLTNSSAAALNAADVGTFIRNIRFELHDAPAGGTKQDWCGVSFPMLTPGEDAADEHIAAPGPTPIANFIQGAGVIGLTYDTDAGVTKTYVEGDEITLSVDAFSIYGKAVDVSAAIFTDVIEA